MSNLDKSMSSGDDGDVSLKGIKLVLNLIFKLSRSNNKRKTLTEWFFNLIIMAMVVMTFFSVIESFAILLADDISLSFIQKFDMSLNIVEMIIALLVTIIFKIAVSKDNRLKGYWKYIFGYCISGFLVNIIFLIINSIFFLLY